MAVIKAGTEAGRPIFTGAEGALGPVTAEEARAALGVAPALLNDMTVYLSPTGSDAEGDGSAEHPYWTINKALAALPRNLNGHTVTVDMAAGTYDYGASSIQSTHNFCSGMINISGKYTGSGATAEPITVVNCYRFDFGGAGELVQLDSIKINAFGDRGVALSDGMTCYLRLVQINGMTESTQGLAANAANVYYIWDRLGRTNLQINNCSYAIVSVLGEIKSYYGIGGTGNKFGVSCSGLVQAPGFPAAETRYTVGSGGRVYVGNQANIPSY